MPEEVATLLGEIRDWRAAKEGSRAPSKYFMHVEGDDSREVELSVWPPNKAQEELYVYLNELDTPEDLKGQRVRARVRYEKTYQDTDQYKLLSLSIIGPPQSQAQAQSVSKPRPPASPKAVAPRTPDPNDRDTLIVDQVLYKGAMERLNNGTDLQQAVAESIAVWDRVRARHYAPEEPNEPAPEADDDLGVIDLDQAGE